MFPSNKYETRPERHRDRQERHLRLNNDDDIDDKTAEGDNMCLRIWRSLRRARRVFRWRNLRTAALTMLVIGFVVVMESVLWAPYQQAPRHYHRLDRRIRHSKEHCRGNPHDEKIFIASNIDNEKMIRGAWGEALRELVEILGGHNVFISIYESSGREEPRDALRELQAKLPSDCSIVTDDPLQLSGLPTVTLPNGEQRVKRSAYLAELRNRALRPLDSSYRPPPGSKFRHTDMVFDRVLFLDDIYFSPPDTVKLLFSTHLDHATGRARYQAACAAGFTTGAVFDDTFSATRDSDGYEIGLKIYPWFAPVGSSRSRSDVKAGKDAVRVRSCWSGMVAFRGDAIQRYMPASPSANASSELAIQFRYEPELFWEAAESCLLFAGLEVKETSAQPEDRGVYINPYVRVSYSHCTWKLLDFFRQFERIFASLQWIVSKVAYPEHNPRRNHIPGQWVYQQVWRNVHGGGRPGGSFDMVGSEASVGGFCGQRRMYVMKKDFMESNRRRKNNWEDVSVPNKWGRWTRPRRRL